MSDRTAESFAVRERLRQVTRAGGSVGLTLGMLAAYLPHRRARHKEADIDYRDAWVRAWAGAVLRVFRVRVDVVGSIPPRAGGRMVVSNHRSALDIGVVLSQFGGRMVSRHDIAGWPGLGAGAKLIGTVFVDRADAKSGMVTIRAMRRLLEEGDTVDVFPEGTTFAGDEVHEFHPGAFVAAVGARAPIVPVGLAYERGSGAAYVDETFGHHLARIAAAPPSRVVVAVGDPIPTEARRAKDVQAETRAKVTELVARARARSDGRA
ncbi:MAG: 1-acyl-sn-glycerol-3-phosphate acyltransferase [Myxococcales bacterium]|nr:1-acyl-sn-glycerol-3-phosphate acyltransferase [Myxococcales bacterium]